MPSSPERAIDLNADLGEGDGEEPLYPLISSANIACGGHAGDAATMRDAVRRALRYGVAIGAHPSYPDPERFGRVTLEMAPAELAAAVAAQIAALLRIVVGEGARLAHVKPHGALYNDAARRPDVAAAVASGVSQISRSLVLVGLAGSTALDVWRQRGFRVAAEGFADRAYLADGTLLPRSQPGALLTDPSAAKAQAIRLAAEGRCTTLCIHSDTPGAVAIASAVRSGIEELGFAVAVSRSRRGRRGSS